MAQFDANGNPIGAQVGKAEEQPSDTFMATVKAVVPGVGKYLNAVTKSIDGILEKVAKIPFIGKALAAIGFLAKPPVVSLGSVEKAAPKDQEGIAAKKINPSADGLGPKGGVAHNLIFSNLQRDYSHLIGADIAEQFRVAGISAPTDVGSAPEGFASNAPRGSAGSDIGLA